MTYTATNEQPEPMTLENLVQLMQSLPQLDLIRVDVYSHPLSSELVILEEVRRIGNKRTTLVRKELEARLATENKHD